MNRRVVITGIGALTCIGAGKNELWDGVFSGKSGIRNITRFDASQFSSQIAGQIDDFNPLDHFDGKRLKRLDRFAQFSLVASKMALDDAKFPSDPKNPNAEVGVCLGTALGGVSCAETQHEIFLRDGMRAVNPAVAILVFGGSGSCHVAMEHGFTGPVNTNSNSCASGTIAVGDAFRLIRGGFARAMIAGAVETPLYPLSFGAFSIIRAMSTRNDFPPKACRPFDAERDGFVMAEGAAVFVVEELEHARARGAKIYAEILGYGLSNDAFSMIAPRPDATTAATCIENALANAQISREKIDYINAHATGTPLGDKAETLAIRKIFGARARKIPTSSTKPMHGHALGASGAIEIAICCGVFERDFLPPTLNYENPDPDCELDCVPNVVRTARVNTILKNSFGFGGINAALVLSRCDGNV
jgi:3-oxoacyl-[acyl-carrier-protein] synthase II